MIEGRVVYHQNQARILHRDGEFCPFSRAWQSDLVVKPWSDLVN